MRPKTTWQEKLADSKGLSKVEPITEMVRSSSGGPCWIRTGDSLLKRQILYLLS